MDILEIDAFSFVRQEITRCLIYEANRQNRSVFSQFVIDCVVNHFNQLTPVPNVCFRTLVLWLAFVVFNSQQWVSSQPWSHHTVSVVVRAMSISGFIAVLQA